MPFSAEDLAQIKSAVSEVVDSRFTSLDSRFTSLDSRLTKLELDVQETKRDVQETKRDVQETKRLVQALVRNEPEVAFRHLQRHVVGKGTVLEEKAIAKGADSTWTYMKYGDKVLAVSAAHCACYYSIKEKERKKKKQKTTSTISDSDPSYDITTKEFIEVPEVLAPFVKSVFFLSDVVGVRSPDTHEDIVVVELQDEDSDKFTSMKNSDSIPLWLTVAGQSDKIDLLGSPLAGVGLARKVYVPSCSWNQSKNYIMFNPDTSQGGHSGTLLFDLQQRKETELRQQCLGVLVGEKKPRGNVHSRGQVCPLPNFEDLVEYPVVKPPPKDFKFQLNGFGRRSITRKDSYRYTTAGRKSKIIYGVFVEPYKE